jgi:tyrosine-specific transport protein
MSMNKSFLLALATLVGTTIGAGIFGLPYVISKAGIIPGLVYFVGLGGVVLVLHLMFGEIALRTTTKHRLIGYARMYVGTWAARVVTVSTVAGIIGALLAYIIIAGDFLYILLGSFIPVSSTGFAVLFWAVCSVFVLRGIQTIAPMELAMSATLFVVSAIIFVFAAPHIQIENIPLFSQPFLLLPYGVILFAFLGFSAIPEIASLFKERKERRSLDNVIVWSAVLCGALYAVFVVFVVGVSGGATSKDALSGLAPFLGEKVVLLGAVFGVVAIAASFLVLGNYLKNSFRYDYKVSYWPAVGITVFAPIVLFFAGLREFIVVAGLVGAMVAVLEGSVIVLVFQKAKKLGDRVPEYSVQFSQKLGWGVIALLVAGIVVEVLLYVGGGI